MYSASFMLVVFVFFFFSSRRRHTRFKCDWSSDVCSSDLLVGLARLGRQQDDRRLGQLAQSGGGPPQIGRTAWGGRGEISGGAGSFKKKKKDSRSGRREKRAGTGGGGTRQQRHRV